MAIYRNIDGITKNSFQVGLRGVTLSTGTGLNETGRDKIKQLLVNDVAVVTEKSFLIPRENVYKLEKTNDGNTCKLSYRYYDKENNIWKEESITLVTEDGDSGIQRVNNPTDGNIVVFNGSDGNKVKDSGFKIITNIQNLVEGEDENTVPTMAVLKQYVGVVEAPLRDRLNGIIKE